MESDAGLDNSEKSHKPGRTRREAKDRRRRRQSQIIKGRKLAEVKQIAQEQSAYGSKPIADLFPESTVLFADIVGE